MNKVILHGRLTRDPELTYTPSGVAVAKFTIAVNRRFKNQQGDREADFINCVSWRQQAESLANHVGKGCRVNVVGTWQTRSFEGQDSKRVYVNECNVEEIDFVDFLNNDNQQSNGQNGQQQRQNNQSNTNRGQNNQNRQNGQNGQNGGYNDYHDPFANNGQIDISDDDLPF